jgi:hypothetical protein
MEFYNINFVSSIECNIIDLHSFLYEALIFIECYDASRNRRIEADVSTDFNETCFRFRTTLNEIDLIRKNAIEFVHFVCNLKNILTNSNGNLVGDHNVSINFSDHFMRTKKPVFNSLVRRLEALNRNRILNIDSIFDKNFERRETNNNDFIDKNTIKKDDNQVKVTPITEKVLSGLFFKKISNLINKTSDFIAYLQENRWNRCTALEILDKLVENCNDFQAIFEKFIQLFQIVLTNDQQKQNVSNLKKRPQTTSTPINAKKVKLFSLSSISSVTVSSPSSSSTSSLSTQTSAILKSIFSTKSKNKKKKVFSILKLGLFPSSIFKFLIIFIKNIVECTFNEIYLI